MMALLALAMVAGPVQVGSPHLTNSLVQLFRLSDEYRQCLILDKTRAAEPRDTFFAQSGTSAENLDLLLADGQDGLLKRLIEQGKNDEIIRALQRVEYVKVDEKHCRDFDPYYSPALESLRDLQKMVGIDTLRGQKRVRPQRIHRSDLIK